MAEFYLHNMALTDMNVWDPNSRLGDLQLMAMASNSSADYIQTPAKASIPPNITVVSPSSSSTSQSTFSTPPSAAHISTPVPAVPAVPFLPVAPFIPINMANRYAPLQFPGNRGAMLQDYERKITYFDGTSYYTT